MATLLFVESEWFETEAEKQRRLMNAGAGRFPAGVCPSCLVFGECLRGHGLERTHFFRLTSVVL